MVVHLFLLSVFLIKPGGGEQLVSNDMYFRDLNECLYFANRVSRTYTSQNDYFGYTRNRVAAYCLPRMVNEDDIIKIY